MSAPHCFGLFLRKVWIGFDFENLLSVTFAVSGDEEHPLIAIKLLAKGAVGSVGAEIVVAGKEFFGLSAAIDEGFQRSRPRAVAIGGFDRVGSLPFVAAIRNLGHDQ